MSSLVNAVEISFRFHKHTVFENVGFAINPKNVVGIVGRNGAGKTTLLKILAKKLEADEGKITWQKDIKIGYLPQEFELEGEISLWENILHSDHFLDHRITWQEEEKISQTLKELNIFEYKNKPCKHLSGGQKRRLAIAKSLLNEPDLLILDEPTNHLDIQTSEHLEKLIKNFNGAIVVVSHDRYFLDRVSTNILEIHQKKIYTHKGNYSCYLKNKEIRISNAKMEEEKRQKWLEKEREWVFAGVKARSTKNKGRLEEYYKIESLPKFISEPKIYKFIPPASFLGNRILNCKNLLIITKDGKKVVENFDLDFRKDMKIGLLGRNGVGKSTFLKTIFGKYKPENGTLKLGKNTRFNYLDQEKALLNPEKTIFQEVAEEKETVMFGDREVNSRAYLKKFMFDPKTLDRFVSNLSGGERTRIVLAKNLCKQANFLILDEPTNDLDIESLEALELSIKDFDGPAIIVSHDRYFLNQVCNYILNFEGDGKFVLSTGNYDNFVKKDESEKKEVEPKIEITEKKIEKKPNPLILEMLEKEIFDLKQKIEDFEEKFVDPAFYTRNAYKIGDLRKRLDQMYLDLEEKENKWLKLNP